MAAWPERKIKYQLQVPSGRHWSPESSTRTRTVQTFILLKLLTLTTTGAVRMAAPGKKTTGKALVSGFSLRLIYSSYVSSLTQVCYRRVRSDDRPQTAEETQTAAASAEIQERDGGQEAAAETGPRQVREVRGHHWTRIHWR